MKTETTPNAFAGSFASYVCEGDSITTPLHNGRAFRATIMRDDCSDIPDERQDGFWPSLDPNDAGYIGAKSRRTLEREHAKAQKIMDAWKNDEWFYCGVVLSIVDEDGDVVSDHICALWGIETNYPTFRKRDRPNEYLTTVANELLDDSAKNHPTVTTQDRKIIVNGEALLSIQIISDENNLRAIEPVEADEMIRRIADLLNLHGIE